MTDMPDLKKIEKELAYYKKRLDELAGENLKHEISLSKVRNELKQKREGFALLSELQQSIVAQQDVNSIFGMTVHRINATVGMDKTIILVPAEDEDQFRPAHFLGFSKEDEERIESLRIGFPSELALGDQILVVNQSTQPDPLIETIRNAFSLPYFVATGISVNSVTLGILLSGRLKEQKLLFPPLDQGDADTFQAIAGLISAAVGTMKARTLEELDRVKTNFFANISHEFRTPITLTIGPLEGLLSGRYGAIPEGGRGQIQTVLRNQVRLLGLVNQILDLAKLESGKMELNACRIPDMNTFVDERVGQFRSMAEKRGLELKSNFAQKVKGAQIYIDPEKMDKVVFNLLSNAHKFTPKGSVEVITDIQEDHFILTVKDSGVGIRSDQIAGVFERFQQAEGSSSREYAGTGIGLALVKELVELHGGTISVQSKYGKGSSFIVRIPVGKAHLDPACISVEYAAPQQAESSTQGPAELLDSFGAEDEQAEILEMNKGADAQDPSLPVVLYVDDNRDLRNYVHGILREQYRVFLALNGKEGFELAMRGGIDLILSDLMMPVMDGVEFLQKVRKTSELEGIPFVLLTAKSGMASKLEGLEEGADDYLNKPFSEQELTARIKNLVALRHQHLKLKRELQAARAIQQALLPAMNQDFGTFSVEALYRPCEELSGDFFDFIDTDEWFYFYLADVTSHGTASAQVTYLLKGLVRSIIEATPEIPAKDLIFQVATRYREFQLDYAVGFQVMRFHKIDRTLEYASSNSPRPIRLHENEVDILKVRPGPLIESQSKFDIDMFPESSVSISPGDELYFFTDGCYEFEVVDKDRELGYGGFSRLFRKMERGSGSEAIFRKLVEARGGENFEDDLTIIRLDIQGRMPETTE